MCEYCGCQEVESIAILTAEHDRLRDLGRELGKAAATGDVRAARDLAVRMQAVLEPHVTVEETGLFPVMRREFGDAIDTLTAEHRLIHGALHSVTAEPPPPDWPQQVHAGLHRLFEHILAEQDGVFPAALATLSGADWDRVDAARAAAGSPLGTKP